MLVNINKLIWLHLEYDNLIYKYWYINKWYYYTNFSSTFITYDMYKSCIIIMHNFAHELFLLDVIMSFCISCFGACYIIL